MGLENHPIEYESDIQWYLIQVNIVERNMWTNEHLRKFSNSLKHDVFGDFNIDFLKNHQDKNYGICFTAFPLEVHKFEPTRVTVKSKTCIGHVVSKNKIQTETVPTFISYYYAKLARFPVLVSESQTTGSSAVSMERKLSFLKKKYCPYFLFLQIHRLNALNENVSANEMVDNATRTIVETVNHFAPERLYAENVIQN